MDRQHPGDRRLLEHELRDHHRPRARVRTSPGQVARVLVVPLEDGGVEVAHRAPDARSGQQYGPANGVAPRSRRGSAGYRERHECRHPSARPTAGSRVLDASAARRSVSRSCWSSCIGRVLGGGSDGSSSGPATPPRQVAGRAQRPALEQRRGAPSRDGDPEADDGQEGQRRPRRRWPQPDGPCDQADVTVEPLIRGPRPAARSGSRSSCAPTCRPARSRSPTTPSR